MDSLTQIALGAAVGEAVIGRKVGNKAILWGGIAGTLPDLDVIIPFADAVKDFTYHRAASHSLFVLAVLTPLLTWLILKIHPQFQCHKRQWLLMIYLVFVTHVLLDSFTAYGTQIFWPIVTTPMAWSTIFIIDPMYTVPLLVGVIAALVMTRIASRGHRLNQYGLILSSIYLGWTVLAKIMVENNVHFALQQQKIDSRQVFTTPSPFNTLLWRAVVKTEQGYFEGYYSIFDKDNKINFRFYASDEGLLAGIEELWSVQRLKWFSKGFYSVSQESQSIVMSDLRMGNEAHYVFRFKVAEISNPHAKPVRPEKLETIRDMGQLKLIWQRIWNQSVDISPRT